MSADDYDDDVDAWSPVIVYERRASGRLVGMGHFPSDDNETMTMMTTTTTIMLVCDRI